MQVNFQSRISPYKQSSFEKKSPVSLPSGAQIGSRDYNISNLYNIHPSFLGRKKPLSNEEFLDNVQKLNKLFIENGTFDMDECAKLFFRYVNPIAEKDYDEVAEKYQVLIDYFKQKGVSKDFPNEDFSDLMDIVNLSYMLPEDKMTPKAISEILDIKDSRSFENPLCGSSFIYYLTSFENFSSCPPIKKYRLLDTLVNNYAYADDSLTEWEAEHIPEDSDLSSFKYVELLKDKEKRSKFINNFLNLSCVKDEKVLEKIDSIDDIEYKHILSNAVNNAEDKYFTFSRRTLPNGNITLYGTFDEYLYTLGGKYSVSEILNNGRIPPTIKIPLGYRNIGSEAFKKDLYLNLKYLNLYDYLISDYGKEDPGFSDYLYENFYLKNIQKDVNVSDETIEKCREINNAFGTKIFLSADSSDSDAVLEAVQKELEAWKIAGKDEAKFPRAINFSLIKQNWYDNESAYGSGPAAATTNHFDETISFAKMSLESVKRNFRHEMTHFNDRNGGAQYRIPKGADSTSPLKEMFDKKLFKEEFINAGISESHANYAYNNSAEFIAVASEGDFSKYSDDFKKLLVALGMPKWELDLK